uniref:chemokine (C-C motif) ligand 34b, duplicate 4 n=1 Tax=Scatophagus argus TaxID=75038 RepID=UPI001ED80BDF|nr:chemokine (C-C motif) ligand 34b, duplicate 4 [Scatophagus argus]
MSTRILSITLLLLFACSLSTANNKRHPTRRFPPPCCVTLSTANISSDVTGDTYRQPPAKRPCVDAIILNTQHGPVCVNPNSEWVQKITANMTKL